MNKYLLIMWHDVEPEILGPYDDEDDREAEARSVRKLHGDGHGLFRLSGEGRPEVSAFRASFFDTNHM